VFASFIFLFFVFASFKQKKRFYFILLLHILSTGGKITHTHIYISNLNLFWYRLLEVLIWSSILPQKHYSYRTISKSPHNQLQLHILSIEGEITT
jgi:hypothetical protein